jgi:predicted Zn finger-like uncharacterized protein
MKVKCLKCQTEYNISADKIPAGAATATCKKCGTKIKVLPPIEGKQKKNGLIHAQRASSAKKVSSTAATPQIKNPHSLGGQVTGIVIASVISLVLFRLGGVLVILVGIFVFLDAWHSGIYRTPGVKHLLNLSPMGWSIAIILLCVLSYPLYAFNRNKQKTKDGPVVYWVLTNVFGIITLIAFLLRIAYMWSTL